MLSDLEDFGLLHLDIKHLNIIVTSEGHLKLIDFESLTKRPEAELYFFHDFHLGTPLFNPPEVDIEDEDLCYYKNVTFDMYAASIVILELLKGKRFKSTDKMDKVLFQELVLP